MSVWNGVPASTLSTRRRRDLFMKRGSSVSPREDPLLALHLDYANLETDLLAGMCYARMTKEQLRTGCDIMHLFFMFDEHSDKCSPDEVWEQAWIQMDAFSRPDQPRPKGEWVGGEFTRQYVPSSCAQTRYWQRYAHDQHRRFWQRLPANATDTFKRRFLGTWLDYVKSVAQQAENRSVSHIMDLETYFPLRRNTSGAPSTIALYELDMNIPDIVREHPTIRELETLAVDLIVIANVRLSPFPFSGLLLLTVFPAGLAVIQQGASGGRRRAQHRHGHHDAVRP